MFAKRLLPLLEAVTEELAAGSVVRPARGTGQIEYSVAMTEQGEALTERRLGGRSKPFRCPKFIYEALTESLAESKKPLSMDEIMAAAEIKLGNRPADFQIRVALRLWMHSDPPMLVRSRSKYSLVAPKGFLVDSKRLWLMLRQ